MGRPSPERRKAKRQRQKVRRKLTYPMRQDQLEVETDATSSGQKELEQPCTLGPIGGADTDLIEMGLYDNFREQDGKPLSQKYLMKCRTLLVSKVQRSNETINKLQRELEKVKMESKEENERIRKYYEVVAYGYSRAGRMVQSAQCSAPSAETVIKDLERIYQPCQSDDE